MSRKRIIDAPAPDPLWYKDAVIYQLHVRAFADSNGDGIGDFPGLVEKLDYLQDLGVTTLWLLPFYPSPLRDDGYDIADYTDVHSSYGTLADFKRFLHEAHRRGLRVITELVVNHTSDQHPWFQRARRAKPGSKARDFYVWSDTPDRYKEARIIFKDFEPSNWTWDPVAGAYFWHRFYHHQPDLNFDNPEVHEAVLRALDFWLGMGVDGLRLDAVPYLYEREGTNCENLPETHAFLKQLRRRVDERYPGRMLLAEANQWPEDAVAYFGADDECHMAFHFPVMPRLFMAVRMEDRFPILDILQQTPPIPPRSQWAMFLRNHDELTLEMVTDEDRDYMVRVYAQDPQARINLGIRRRLAPLLENHRRKIELLNGLLFSLPGTPVVYYGDEIGMGDNIYLGDRNGVRTPMQWTGERNAGFSKANPQRLYLPLIIDPEYHFEAVNVEAQRHNPHSLLWWAKHLIALRKRHRAFGRGSLDFLTPVNAKVLAFVRTFGDERVLVVANLSRFAQPVELDLAAFRGLTPIEMFGRTRFPTIGDRPYQMALGPYAFYWLTLEVRRAEKVSVSDNDGLPTVEVVDTWENVFSGAARQELDALLPEYLRQRPWFAGRVRQTEAAMVLETIPIPYRNAMAYLAFIQVEYTEGDSDTVLLPLAFVSGDDGHAADVVCRLRIRGRGDAVAEGVLHDPTWERDFLKAVLDLIVRKRRLKRAAGELAGVPAVAHKLTNGPAGPAPEPAVLPVEQGHTSAAFGDRFVLKVLRRVEEGVNPQWEVEQFLAERTPFRQAARPAGQMEYRRGWGEPMTLAILESFIPNQGSAWRFTLDALGRYYESVLAQRKPDEPPPPAPASLLGLLNHPLPPRLHELAGTYFDSARLLGQRTAELHAALSASDDPAFAPEPFTTLYQRSLYQSLRTGCRQTLEMLRARLPELRPDAEPEARKLLEHEADLLKRSQAILGRKVSAVRLRGHGDFHLGQVLVAERDFVVVDFESEADRTLADRRRKRTPLRDVASMVRSFQYAAYMALQKGGVRPEDVPALEPWAEPWHRWVSAAFLKAYLETAPVGAVVPVAHEDLELLLDYYLLKRAVNELRYELHYHPERIRIPLLGLLQALAS